MKSQTSEWNRPPKLKQAERAGEKPPFLCAVLRVNRAKTKLLNTEDPENLSNSPYLFILFSGAFDGRKHGRVQHVRNLGVH